MSEPEPPARVFMQPPGCDFPQAVVDGLIARADRSDPTDLARTTLIVNSARMAENVRATFLRRGPGLLPRLLRLDQLDQIVDTPLPASRHPLARRLQLAQLILPVIERFPELAARSALFSVADSLAALLDEMQLEDVTLDTIAALDVTDLSGHWQFAQSLIGVAGAFVTDIDGMADAAARQVALTRAVLDAWETAAPPGRIVLAGSTGSRQTTFDLMRAIARLPNGAIVLPGFDAHQPADVWGGLNDALNGEDHPQFRYARLLAALGCMPGSVPLWHATPPPDEARNKVVSLALRPAPVTDAWLREGPNLPDLQTAMAGVTLLEAQSPREEALAIAMRLRQAAEEGIRAAFVTPDRVLSRQVTAALDRWDLRPDDSAGIPLQLTPPGRFLRHTAELLTTPLDAEMLLILLKHPLTQSGGMVPRHGLYTQRFELFLRRRMAPFPGPGDLAAFLAESGTDPAMERWADWLGAIFFGRVAAGSRPLADWLAAHRALSEAIAGGDATQAGGLWDKAAGREARAAFETLEVHAHHAGDLSATDYGQLLDSVLAGSEIRASDDVHPMIRFWGTFEVRAQAADLVILGGLNDGVWPEAPAADPWLNRQMRHRAGLLLPDRRIGLAAHDFQLAIAAPEVWLTRATRSDDAETVPSRWLNRLTNLVAGLPMRGGPEALAGMRARGQDWVRRTAQLEATPRIPPEPRAAPVPPVAARPRSLSVTEIKTLIRDPYAIYARHCLGLRPLDPLVREPDAPLRGIVIHEIMERFIRDVTGDADLLALPHLLQVAGGVLDARAPWPAARVMWRAALRRVGDWIIDTERSLQARGRPAALEAEARARLDLPALGVSITGRADRIDLDAEGRALLYDYKSGAPPSRKEQKHFDKQLLIEAAMIEEGAFTSLGPRKVDRAAYLGLGSSPGIIDAPLEDEPPAETLAGLVKLFGDFLAEDQHFLSRRMLQTERFLGAYDQLARHGEWEDADTATPLVLK